MRIAHKYIAISTLCLVAITTNVVAADYKVKQLEQQVVYLGQVVKDLQDAWRQQGADIAQKMAAVDEIRGNWNSFQGTVDAISQQQQILLDSFRKYIDEFDGRLRSLEEKFSGRQAELTESAAPNVTEDGPVVTVPVLAAPAANAGLDTYESALAAVRNRNYEAAITQFKHFLTFAANHELAESAEFWIAECLYALGQYEQAVTQYQQMVTRYPQSDKLASALFKQAQAYAALGNTEQSAQQLKRVMARVPSSPEAKHAKTQLRAIEQATRAADRVR